MTETVVIFRRWRNKYGGGIIALFPEDGDPLTGLVQSFEHEGQHGGADYYGVLGRSYPAHPHEYEPLKKELESPPYRYRLKIRKRRPHES